MSRWISHCAALFHDRRVGLVAPRVAAASSGPHVARGRRRTSARAIARYEETESPLDLGPDPGLVGAGHRLSYAPAAALVLRRRALDEVGWFDETLRYGEDVDLVRRLGDAGWMCRYEPSAVVGHVGRGSLRAFIWQRACYGSSAAALDRRHPGTLAPFSAAPTITAAAVGVVALVTGIRRHPARALAEPPAGTFATALATALAAALAGTSSAVVVRRLARALHKAGCPAATRQATAVTGRSVLGSALWLLTAFRRAWWPICLPLVVGGGRRIRRRFAVMAAVSLMCGHGPEAARDARRHGAKAAVTHLVLGAMDDAAYTSGVWWGCARERSLGALLPQIRGISGNSGTSRISRISGIRGTRTGRRAR